MVSWDGLLKLQDLLILHWVFFFPLLSKSQFTMYWKRKITQGESIPIDPSTVLWHVCYNTEIIWLKATVLHTALYSSHYFDFTKKLLKRPYGNTREKPQTIRSLQNASRYAAISFTVQNHIKSRAIPGSLRFFLLIWQNSSPLLSLAFSWLSFG